MEKMKNEEINKAMEPTKFHDACDACGKRTDGLMTCTYSHCDDTTKLCPDCMKDSGFCYGCGYYSAGISSFDFSRMPNYCATCVDEIEEMDNDNEDLTFY